MVTGAGMTTGTTQMTINRSQQREQSGRSACIKCPPCHYCCCCAVCCPVSMHHLALNRRADGFFAANAGSQG